MPTNLMDGQTGPASTSNPNTNYTIGNRFTVSVDTPITGLRWHRRITTTANKPYNLKLWGSNTLQPLAVVNNPNDDGTVGWQLTSLTGSVVLVPGETYTVSMFWPNGQDWEWIAVASRVAPPSPFSWATNARGFLTGSDGFPSTVDNTLIWMVDVQTGGTLSGGAPVGGGASAGDVSNTLADWFDPTDATKPTGNPKLYPDTIIGLHGKIDNDGVTWDAKLGPMQTYGSVGNKGISAGVEIVRQAVLALPTPASPGSITTLSAAVAALQSDLDAFEAATTLNFRRLQGAVSVPGTGWALIDTTTFVNSLAWAQPADLYVVSFTVTPERISPTDVAGVLWYPHLAWWAVLNGDFVQGERHFVDFASAHLIDQGRRMPGLLLHANYGGEATAEAWQLS